MKWNTIHLIFYHIAFSSEDVPPLRFCFRRQCELNFFAAHLRGVPLKLVRDYFSVSASSLVSRAFPCPEIICYCTLHTYKGVAYIPIYSCEYQMSILLYFVRDLRSKNEDQPRQKPLSGRVSRIDTITHGT